MTAIKVCGVKKAETYDLLLELKVNWAGLVFYPSSPRYIAPDQARSLPNYKDYGLSKVGLFVEPTIDDVAKVLDKIQLDILQIYSTPENAKIIKEFYKIPVWIAHGVSTQQDLPQKCSVDGMIIESSPCPSDTQPGGNGRVFDWHLTKGWNAPKPWLLAGGLTPDNVVQAIKQSGAKAVDVSSGIERQKGEKDTTLIRRFVKNVRNFTS